MPCKIYNLVRIDSVGTLKAKVETKIRSLTTKHGARPDPKLPSGPS
jgi:hypothetical protein